MPPRIRLLLLLLAAGCAGPGEREAAALKDALASGEASLAAVTAGGRRDAAPQALGVAMAPAAVPEASRLRPATAGPAPESAVQLLGASPEAVRRWMGEPSLRRHEGSAEIWLYAGHACALDVVLYDDAQGLRVGHAAARATGTEPRTEAACLGELAAHGLPPRAVPATARAPRAIPAI